MATGSMSKGPGKSYREGLSLDRLFRMFPTDEAAEAWFHGGALAGWAVLPALRLSQYPVRHRASDHDASGRGRRGLYRRQAQEHAEVQGARR